MGSKLATQRTVRKTWPLYILFIGVAGLVGMGISWGFLTESLAALGIPDPGRITTASLPFLRAASWMLVSLGVGSFLASGFLISPRIPDRDNTRLLESRLSVDGHIAARTGSISMLFVALIATTMIPITLSDVSGNPLSQAIQPGSWAIAINQVSAALAWAWMAGIAALIGICGLFSHKWSSQPVFFVGAILTVIPLGLDGHSASGGDHDWGTNSYLWHLVFLSLWIGGLMALLAHGRRLGPGMALAVQRYSKIALVSVLVMSISGLVNAAIRISWEDWFTTTYGWIITTKTALVILLALLGFIHRQHTIPALEKGDTRAFHRVSIIEVLLMAATVGVAITMGRTPPPPPRDPNLSIMAVRIGFDLHKAPTFWNVWTTWRFDYLFAVLAILAAVYYLRGLRKLRQQGIAWPLQRTLWFLLGCLSLGLMMTSGMGMNMMALFSMHMVVHMGLSMVVPVFLVLGAPFTLIMAATKPGPPGQPGLHEWTQALCSNRLTRAIMHPGVNTVQFVALFYVLYVSPFYEVLVRDHGGHVLMNFVFLISGYLYFWDMIGPDPVPNRRSVPQRLAWLAFSMPFHLYFGVYLMQLNDIIGYNFYSTLGLPWNPDLLTDQKIGGGIAWASGAFPLLVVFGSLFYQWLRDDKREARAYDTKAASDGDTDMAAYNEMLAALSEATPAKAASAKGVESPGELGDSRLSSQPHTRIAQRPETEDS
ncbi:cytochrome c oxidase assembly protein [Corynebacterium caspium]|uniref:cytochrome c oxidase assembly protein n=1 Tax=Corynebacterium caspium TaxID=234828 RepID=UPI00037E0841|nr:cytochrome c oxidase assembly protein [Corynebacterium caspium]WKD58821.1 Copper transport protein YcnJ precursor [Corynebacterium caspium DSM 44850]